MHPILIKLAVFLVVPAVVLVTRKIGRSAPAQFEDALVLRYADSYRVIHVALTALAMLGVTVLAADQITKTPVLPVIFGWSVGVFIAGTACFIANLRVLTASIYIAPEGVTVARRGKDETFLYEDITGLKRGREKIVVHLRHGKSFTISKYMKGWEAASEVLELRTFTNTGQTKIAGRSQCVQPGDVEA